MAKLPEAFTTNDQGSDHRLTVMDEQEINISNNILDWYRSGWMDKDERNLFEKWETMDLYWEGDQNEPESDNDPASNTNIVNPNVEGQVAHLIEQNLAIQTKGRTPSDEAFADIARVILEFVKERNKMRRKLDVHERRRMKYGTGIFRVLFDPDKLDGMGLPVIDVCNPAYVFPDPNITDIYRIQEGRFLIETMMKSISWARESGLYPRDRVDAITPSFEPIETGYIFGEEDGESDTVSRDHYLHMLVWFRDKRKVKESKTINDIDGVTGEEIEVAEESEQEEWYMRLIEMSGDGIILRDTKDDPDFVIPGNIYPYFFTPDMFRDGMVWGKGTAELLVDTQDLINDIDDSVRINARLTGNPQRWVSTESGVDPDKWSNDGGLTLPTDSQNGPGVGYLDPPSMPQYIIERRNMAFVTERQVQTRFGDQQSGIKQQGVDTATEALALQQGANAGVTHKKMLLEETLSEVFEHVLELCMEYWDQEMAFRVTEKTDDYQFFRPSDLGEVPVLIPSTEGYQRNFIRQLQYMGIPVNQAPNFQPLMDGDEPVTKKVSLDISITVGAGLPNNKAFVYSIIKENANLLPPQTYLRLLKEYVGLPVTEDDIMPQQPQPTQPDGQPLNPEVAGLTPSGNPMAPQSNPALQGVI